MPWKFCPACKQISYSAATRYDSWLCPYCAKQLKGEPEFDGAEAIELKNKYSPESTSQKA